MKNNVENTKNVLDHFYHSRVNFEIVAMTGLEGAGCSTFVNAMCENIDTYIKKVRNPNVLDIGEKPNDFNNSSLYFDGKNNSLFLSKLVAKRKYTFCYNFFSKRYVPFTRVQYTKVLWLYSLLYCYQNNITFSADVLRSYLYRLLKDKFCGSKAKTPDDVSYVKIFGTVNNSHIEEILSGLDLINLVKSFKKISIEEGSFLDCRGESAQFISDLFFDENSAFNVFFNKITHTLDEFDYYYLTFFYHRLATVIRTFGNPEKESSHVKDAKTYDHVFDVVKLINVLVKGLRHKKEKCRIVIDSIRNVIEASYLKERYGAFYLIAICTEKREGFLEEKITKHYDKEKHDDFLVAYNTIKRFVDKEAESKEYEEGKFSHPNTALCVANADIHIANRRNDPANKQWGTYFKNMYEQWMKFASLMLHPGLITPSAEERCMSVAYVSSFNSSCVSRKVGAVITNQAHAIRTIGWNDAPYGQLPCGLRSLSELTEEKKCEFRDICFSEFERDKEEKRYDNCSFIDSVKKDYIDISKYEDREGVPFSYCFRSLDNKYSGEKNQVHTRSLHAEENALIQMAKYGGEPLKNGVIYVTASPCELCSKKLYQVGIRRIVYIEDYPGIAMEQIIHTGVQQPELKRFEGAFGDSFNKLYRPFLSHKDELEIGIEHKHGLKTSSKLMEEIMKELGEESKSTYSKDEYNKIIKKVKSLVKSNPKNN